MESAGIAKKRGRSRFMVSRRDERHIILFFGGFPTNKKYRGNVQKGMLYLVNM